MKPICRNLLLLALITGIFASFSMAKEGGASGGGGNGDGDKRMMGYFNCAQNYVNSTVPASPEAMVADMVDENRCSMSESGAKCFVGHYWTKPDVLSALGECRADLLGSE